MEGGIPDSDVAKNAWWAYTKYLVGKVLWKAKCPTGSCVA